MGLPSGRYRWTVTGAGIFLSVAFIFYGILPYHLAARDSLRSGTLQRRHYVLLDPVRGRVWAPNLKSGKLTNWSA